MPKSKQQTISKTIEWRSQMEAKPILELLKDLRNDKKGSRSPIFHLIQMKLRTTPPDQLPQLHELANIISEQDSVNLSCILGKTSLSRKYMKKFWTDPTSLTPDEIRVLSLDYPFILHIKICSSVDNYPLHLIAYHGYRYKDTFELVLDQCLKHGVLGYADLENGYGGLMRKNKKGQSPLAIMYSVVVYYCHVDSLHPRWVWLASIIEKVAKHYYNERYGHDDTRPFHLLHAALDMGCPIGIINHILSFSSRSAIWSYDLLGRLPLHIATSKHNMDHRIVIDLLTRYPRGATVKDSTGNTPLNLVLQNKAKDSDGRIETFRDEVNVIGRFVEYCPQSLELGNDEKLLPFMLAAVDQKWSLGIVYCLLRTSPSVMNEYVA